ncbi:MAG: hypothetical protein CME68_11465 [Halobacteriovoraceae bacterium]|nr:hypothetical protein [Halobacteriovoraceae bacterium]
MNLMIITNLNEKPELFEQTLNLIEDSLGYFEPYRFDIDFHPLMEKMNWKNNYVIFDQKNNLVVSHIGVNVRILKNSFMTSPIALLGGISVHRDYRGKGLFKKLMDYVVSKFNKKVSLFILWSDLKELYNKFNFYEAGIVFQTGNMNLSENKSIELFFEKTKLSSLNKSEIQELKLIYESYSEENLTYIERGDEHWDMLKNITSCDLYLFKRKGKIQGYFFANKGLDLQNIIHEIGIKNSFKKEFLDHISPYKLWLPEKLNHNEDFSKNTFLAFFKVGSKKLFKELVHQLSNKNIVVKNIFNESILYIDRDVQKKESIEYFLNYLLNRTDKFETNFISNPIYFSGLESI